MTMRRRDFLAAVGGVASVAMLAGRSHARSLLLYSQDLHRDARALRGGAGNNWIEQQVSVLTHEGFAATSALIEHAAPCRVVALLDDTDALVIERMLAKRGVREMTMRRAGGTALLLTATLQRTS